MPKKPTRLLFKPEVLKRVGVSYPTIWKWMMAGKFPRSRLLGEPGSKTAKVAWYEHEIEAWLVGLPLQALKGDEDPGHSLREGVSGHRPPTEKRAHGLLIEHNLTGSSSPHGPTGVRR